MPRLGLKALREKWDGRDVSHLPRQQRERIAKARRWPEQRKAKRK